MVAGAGVHGIATLIVELHIVVAIEFLVSPRKFGVYGLELDKVLGLGGIARRLERGASLTNMSVG